MSIIGDRIKQLRKEHDNLPQAALASLLDTTEMTISRYENGRDPGIENIKKLAEFFDVTVDYLTGFSDIRYPIVRISGDDLTDTLATLFSSMLKARLDRASQIDNEIQKNIKPTPDAIAKGVDHVNCYLSNTSIVSYVYDMIERIGFNIDFCLDNIDKWFYEKDGRHVIRSDVANKLLDETYYYKMKLQNASAVNTQEFDNIIMEKCKRQQASSGKLENRTSDI